MIEADMARGWILVVALLCASPAAAGIWSWRAPDGTTHYTNRWDDIPVSLQDQAEEVVRGGSTEAAPVEAGDAGVTTPPSARRQRVQRLSEMVANRLEIPEPPVRDAPAVRQDEERPVRAPSLPDVPSVPTEAWAKAVASGSYPAVTSGFDSGRARHLTYRMRAQKQFQFPERLDPRPVPWWEGLRCRRR